MIPLVLFGCIIALLIFVLVIICTPQFNRRCIETYNFVKALSERETPQIVERMALGYLHEFTLVFKEVKIEVEYNDIRGTWEMEIWCFPARTFLFYHDILDIQPRQAIDFLIEKYDLGSRLDAALKRKQESEEKQHNIANNIIKKTLK